MGPARFRPARYSCQVPTVVPGEMLSYAVKVPVAGDLGDVHLREQGNSLSGSRSDLTTTD